MQSRSFDSSALLAIIGLILVSSTVFAGGTSVWGIDQDEFRGRVESGDHEFLRHIDISRHDLRDALRLGDEAAYLLALIFDDLEIHQTADALLMLGWKRSPEPWRRLAVGRLLVRVAERGSYAELEKLSREAVGVYEEPGTVRYLVEALYWQKRDLEASEWLERLSQLVGDLSSEIGLSQEMALWRAVIGFRLNVDGWTDLYRAAYREFPASDVHSRLWVYLQAQPGLRAEFRPAEIRFFRTKQLLAEGRSGDALASFRELVRDGENLEAIAGLIFSPYGLLDLYRIGVSNGSEAEAARLFGAIRDLAPPDLPDDLSRRVYEYTGRLYRRAGLLSEAEVWLSRSLEMVTSGPDEQRVRWYLMTVLADLSPVRLARSLGNRLPLRGDPAYFSDVLIALARRLVEQGEWDELRLTYEKLVPFATPGALAHYELALSLAATAGLTSFPTGGASELLSRAASQSEDVFASLVSSVLLGQDGVAALDIADRHESLSKAAPPVRSPIEEELHGYLTYGLLSHAYEVITTTPDIPPEMLLSAATALARDGRIPQAMRIASLLARKEPGPHSRTVAELIFPTAFRSLALDAARSESVDPWLFLALVREESHFDPDVESAAGAIGLTQLLPATADDVAGRMGIETPDLRKPASNLALGARYMSMLTDQFGGVLKALAAYNGGQGRVRQWERRWPGYEGFLFHLFVPFEETYNHIRKVVVSASYYGYLYAGRSPAETINLVFQGM